jgi:hypothetical protein|tara:strand:- start:2628 stop:3044 length:417 start_codon:yes stop_codon:yes gene_type:complete
MSTEFELFPGKSLGGLFKDIYDNQQTKKLRISELIAEMRKLVRHSQDMMAMGPIIRDLIDSSVRNDDALIKMAAIAQRIIGNNQKSEGDSGFLSNDEKEQLLKELDQTISEVSNEHDIKLDDITNEVEELKLKVGKNE